MSLVFLVPTLNEEKGIGKVIDNINSLNVGRHSILVVDGNSKDNTVKIARKKGAKVLMQKSKGKGAGMHEAIAILKNEDTVVLVDGDDTYALNKVPEMLKLVNYKTTVNGKRIPVSGSMPILNHFGNFSFNLMASLFYFNRIEDMLTGLRIFKVKMYRSLNLNATNFEIETEMTIKALRNNITIIEIPIDYTRRAGDTNLDPFKDGFRILRRIILTRFIKNF